MTFAPDPGCRSTAAWSACLAAALGFFVLCSALPASAQAPAAPPGGQTAPPSQPESTAEAEPITRATRPRETPRAAALGFLQAARTGDYAAAAEFLDLSRTPNEDGERLARHLKFVLDQKLWVLLEKLSDEPGGDRSDGLARRDSIGEIEGLRGPVPIWLERRGDQWRIAATTVAQIEPLYAEFGLGPLGEYLPPVMFTSLGDLQMWQWLGMLLLVVAAYLLSALAVTVALRLIRRLVKRTWNGADDELALAAAGPLTALALIGFFSVGAVLLRLSPPAQQLVSNLAQVFTITSLAWFAMRAIDVAARAFEQRLADRTDTTILTVIPVGRRLAKLFLLMIALLAGLQNLGFNVISIIAGLGVIGIGVALAAQKTFENFFGTLSILIDQPIRRGNFCRFGDQVGTVEDIGLRSTRIRTLDRTIITLPNADFSSKSIENFTARDQIRLTTTIGLRYETSPDQLRHVLMGIKRLLVAHERVAPDPARARFVGFGAFSLDVEIWAYIKTTDYNEFIAIREDLLLQIMEVVTTSGTGFAFPSQTLYLSRDAGLDGTRARAAEAEVQRQRELDELALPDPLPEAISKLQRTIAYPPRGSALARHGRRS